MILFADIRIRSDIADVMRLLASVRGFSIKSYLACIGADELMFDNLVVW